MDSIRQKVEQFRKDVKPAIRCFRPYRTWNRYLGLFEYHNCGKCPYCLSLRSSELAKRCTAECSQHKYCIFFTLTYDNEHIPYVVCSGKWFYLANRTVKSIDGNSVPIVHISEFDLDPSKRIETSDGPVDIDAYGVCHLPDIQRFQKRLRINLNRELNKYDKVKEFDKYQLRQQEIAIRLFISPEYGPTTYRPHYHGILWTDCKEVANLCLDPFKGSPAFARRPNVWHGIIYKSWQMCSPERCDVQHVNSSAPRYVSEYVAGSYNLPKVLRLKPFRPKSLASKNPIIGSYKVDFEKIKDVFFNGLVETLEYDDKSKEFTYVPVSYSSLLRWFPRCQAYSVQNDYDKLQLYRKYEHERYVKRPIERHGCLDAHYNIRQYDHNLDYVDDVFNDNFRYQNLRFFRLVKFWSSRSFRFPVRDPITGVIMCYKSVRLSPLEVIRKFDKLYSNLALYQLRNFYLEQEVVSNSQIFDNHYIMLTYLMSYYPTFLDELKPMLSTHADVSRIYPKLLSFGLFPSDVYQGNILRKDIIHFIQHSNVISSNFVKNQLQFILDHSKSKKYKECYARSKGIIF